MKRKRKFREAENEYIHVNRKKTRATFQALEKEGTGTNFYHMCILKELTHSWGYDVEDAEDDGQGQGHAGDGFVQGAMLLLHLDDGVAPFGHGRFCDLHRQLLMSARPPPPTAPAPSALWPQCRFLRHVLVCKFPPLNSSLSRSQS